MQKPNTNPTADKALLLIKQKLSVIDVEMLETAYDLVQNNELNTLKKVFLKHLASYVIETDLTDLGKDEVLHNFILVCDALNFTFYAFTDPLQEAQIYAHKLSNPDSTKNIH